MVCEVGIGGHDTFRRGGGGAGGGEEEEEETEEAREKAATSRVQGRDVGMWEVLS